MLINLLFVGFLSWCVHRFGHHLEYRGASPDVFLILGLYYLSKGPSPHLILLTAACGWASDVLSGHAWSMDAAFLVMIHLVMDRLKFLGLIKNVFGFVACVVVTSCLHQLWWMWMLNVGSFSLWPAMMVSNLVFGFALWWISKGLRVGWGLRAGAQDPYRILNA